MKEEWDCRTNNTINLQAESGITSTPQFKIYDFVGLNLCHPQKFQTDM